MTDNQSKANDIELELTIGDLFFAMKTTKETPTTAPVYDDKIVRIPNIKKIVFKGNGKSTDIYASGKKFGTIAQETSIEVTHTHIGMPVAVIDAMKGVAAEHGVEFGTTDAKAVPEFALGFDTILANGVHDGIWLTSVTLDPAVNETHSTSEDAYKEVNPDIVYNAGGLRNTNVYFSRFNSARDSADISIDDFFGQVIFSPESLATVAGGTKDVAPTGVTVKSPTASVAVGKTVELGAAIQPDNVTDKVINNSSSDETIATVSDSGTITGVKAGEADITAASHADPTKKATTHVTVTA